MKKYIIPIIATISLIVNVVLISIICCKSCNVSNKEASQNLLEDVNYRKECAQNLLRQIITSNLYIPESYDPVYLQVDSAFHGPLTDSKCLEAALKLIELKNELPGAEDAYKEALHTLKNFGSSGVFWRHAEDKKNAEEHLNSIKESIKNNEEIITNRDTSHDGEFIGWQIIHRYRAKSQGGEISFSDELYIVNPEMTGWMFRYNLQEIDSKNLQNIDKVIKQTLGIYIEE